MDLEMAYGTINRHGVWQMHGKIVWSWKKIVESTAEFLYG